MNKNLILLCLCVSFIFSCKKNNDDKVNVVFTIKSTNKTANGRSYKIDDSKTKIFFSNFKYIDSVGAETLVKDVFLYKTDNNNFSFDLPKGTYSSFRFSFGLDKTTNNFVPMSFPASSPLSVEEGMYWDMLKYRFLIIGADIDDSPTKDQLADSPFSMHLGTDTMYAEINVTSLPTKGSTLEIELDMDKLFVLDTDPFLISNFSNHSEPSEISRGVAIKNSFVSGIKTSVHTPL